MRINHHCEVPGGGHGERTVGAVVDRWQCPECGDHWKIKRFYSDSMAWVSWDLPSLRHWRWQRRIRSLLAERAPKEEEG